MPLVPLMPFAITLHGIHCDALRRMTMMMGVVARFKGMLNCRLRGGAFERRIRGRGIVTDFMTKMID